jgi:RNA polymerase subunit RPABC4/transcription elongation factor Spt4
MITVSKGYMAKKLASKKNKRILTDADIRELSLSKSDFTSSWQGRIFVHDAAKSEIAQKVHITEKGEYAIKVR